MTPTMTMTRELLRVMRLVSNKHNINYKQINNA